MKKLLVLAALAALVLAGVAGAVGDIVQLADGTYRNIRTGQYTDADGNVLVAGTGRDRDYSQVRNLIGPITSLAPGASVTSTSATALGEYTSLLVMVSWNTAAAADSDSVAFGISFIGKISSDVNDGYDFLLSPTDTARFARVDTTIVPLQSQFKPHTNYIISWQKTRYLGGSDYKFALKAATTASAYGGAIKPYLVPQSRVVWSDGRNGVCFNLVNNGQPVKVSHLMVQVQNLCGTVTYTNVKVDVWPKVN